MKVIRRVLSYSAELGGGNIHEYSSGFFFKTYWYTNNLTEDLGRKFHKTQKRKDIQTLEKLEYNKVAEFIFRETDNHPYFIGLPADKILKKLKIEKDIIEQMCSRGLLQRGFYKPKEPKKFLFWVTRGTDEIEVIFPTRTMVTAYFVKKERSGEAREIKSRDYKGEIEI